jgi:RND family efflux transporter MFP subunit
MKHVFWLSAMLCAVAFAPVGQSVAADANARPHDQEPSVLATITPLKKGSLPQTVNAFGTIETGPEGKRTMMAPTSAIVDDIYVRSGEEVRNGAPLIRLGPSPGTAASYAKAQSSLSAAKALVQRVQDLLDQHLATRQQLADAKNSAADAKATITALEAEGAARPQTLRSPFDAIITSVPATLGALVSQGTPLLALARPDVLVLTAGVIPDNASKIQVGQEVKVSSLGGDRIVSGKVTFREAVVDPKTGLVPIEVSLPPDSFIPGQPAEAEIQVGRIQGYIVPHEAVLVNDNGSPYVVQSKHLIARKVPVEILLHAGDRDVVSGALDPQSPLVLAGNYQLQEGSRLRVAEPGTAATQ